MLFLKKSWRIVKGNWWRTFVLGLIVMVFVAIVYFTLTIVLMVGTFAGLDESTAGIVEDVGVVIDGVVGTWIVAVFVMAYLQLTGRQKSPEDEVLAQVS